MRGIDKFAGCQLIEGGRAFLKRGKNPVVALINPFPVLGKHAGNEGRGQNLLVVPRNGPVRFQRKDSVDGRDERNDRRGAVSVPGPDFGQTDVAAEEEAFVRKKEGQVARCMTRHVQHLNFRPAGVDHVSLVDGAVDAPSA